MTKLAYQKDRIVDHWEPLGQTITAQSLRYPRLLGKQWSLLPSCIQRRFTKYHEAGSYSLYKGEVLETRTNLAGKILTILGKLFKSPLPALDIATGPAMVIVRESHDLNAQCWTRVYPKKDQSNQLIQSMKRFTGPTGLVEMITPHIGLRIQLNAQDDRLTFVANEYFLKFGQWCLNVPHFLAPGTMTVSHIMIDETYFHFTLQVVHPYFGELLYQKCTFKEAE